jgi:phosphoribosylglycinamide formyltransferase-1
LLDNGFRQLNNGKHIVMRSKIRIGALISGGGTNLQAIIDACNAHKISGQMVFVASDNPQAVGLKRSRQHGIPTFSVNYGAIIRQFKTKPEKLTLPKDLNLNELLRKQSLFDDTANAEKVHSFFLTRVIAEAKMLEKMKPYPFDLLVLAGFMRTLTPYFIDRVNLNSDDMRIMNIHPALLPAFPGLDGYSDTFHFGCKVGGATVHFVDYGEDSGPIIGQKAFPILETDTLQTIKKKGLENEWSLYPKCIQLFAQGRLMTQQTVYRLANGHEKHRTIVKILSPGNP